MKKIFTAISSLPYLAEFLALLAGGVYLGLSLYYAHQGNVTMDEGTYLMKGLLYVRGDYRPFQEYGPWTNKMPLAFLIPGAAQYVFGPGLRTGRYFSIFLGLLMLLALWLVTRRLAGKGWAAAVAWTVALNVANLSFYSGALTQVIVASMLAWVCALVLGEKRPLWQLILGTILSCLIIFTRQNMAPVVVFVLAYIFWQHGRRAGIYASAAAALTLLVGHAVYYPGIMSIWADMLPSKWTPFLNPWRIKLSAGSGWEVELNDASQMYIFWEGIRFNFGAMMGALVAAILWQPRRLWKSPAAFKAAVMLAALLLLLAAMHLYASLGKSYCPYCYSGYLSFFSFLGLILVAVSYPSWNRRPGFVRQVLALGVVFVGCTGIFFGAQQKLDDFLLTLPVPRIRNMQILPGSSELWRLLSNKFGFSYEFLQQAIPTAAGVLVGLGLIVIAFILVQLLKKRWPACYPAAYVALMAFLVLGVFLSPTPLLGGGKDPANCGGDVIAAHEAAGKYLAGLIPPGSQVYWENDTTPLPLLYLPGVKVYPAQLNHWYSYLSGGDDAQLLRLGFWNASLATQWKKEADYALLANKYVKRWYNNAEIAPLYDELSPSPAVVPCRDRSGIYIFKRITSSQ